MAVKNKSLQRVSYELPVLVSEREHGDDDYDDSDDGSVRPEIIP